MPPHFPPRPKRERIRTSIWQEEPCDDNPFVAEKTLCHGYDFDELACRFSWTQMVFLLLKGELPSKDEDRLINLLMTAAINPGPRDAAVRAAMNCGVGKTPVATIVTTGLTVRGGMAEGSLHVETAMRLLLGDLVEAKNIIDGDESSLKALISDYDKLVAEDRDRDVVPLPDHPPGFGHYFSQRDPRPMKLIRRLDDLGHTGPYLCLSRKIELLLAEDREIFHTLAGVFAAVCCDLGLSPEQGGGLFLIAGTGGILAHGVEQLPRKWTEYPFWSDPAHYEYTGISPEKAGESNP
ncbi:MAG: hypothetical protein R8K46_02785 [Mariprofundaceae bacterium]